MKKDEILELADKIIKEVLAGLSVDNKMGRKPRTSHLAKYKKSKLHPDEIEKRKRISAIQKNIDNSTYHNELSYNLPPNIKVFLETTLETLPDNEVAKKILHGHPISKQEAMNLARTLMAFPRFPFQQPRKLMNLLILLSIDNRQN